MQSKDIRPSARGCTGCAHWRAILRGWSANPVMACHYLLDTGKVRGCLPLECNKREEVHTA